MESGGRGRERRAGQRVAPGAAGWEAAAVLRPGRVVTVVDVGHRDMRLRTQTRVVPGARVDLHLMRAGVKQAIAGRVLRCSVCGLRPLSFEAAIQVDTPLLSGGQAHDTETPGKEATPGG